MDWTVISESRDERTERAVTPDGDVLYRSVWLAPSLRLGQPMQIAFGLAVGRKSSAALQDAQAFAQAQLNTQPPAEEAA